jgi:hypothetical protein
LRALLLALPRLEPLLLAPLLFPKGLLLTLLPLLESRALLLLLPLLEPRTLLFLLPLLLCPLLAPSLVGFTSVRLPAPLRKLLLLASLSLPEGALLALRLSLGLLRRLLLPPTVLFGLPPLDGLSFTARPLLGPLTLADVLPRTSLGLPALSLRLPLCLLRCLLPPPAVLFGLPQVLAAALLLPLLALLGLPPLDGLSFTACPLVGPLTIADLVPRASLGLPTLTLRFPFRPTFGVGLRRGLSCGLR